jgi:hypothetical protein
MTRKLNQVVALEKGVKARTTAATTALYHQLQKTALVNGVSRTYEPLDEDGEKLPAERTMVQLSVEKALAQMADLTAGMLDVIATKDDGNLTALGTIEVAGLTAVSLPVPTLLAVLKELVDWRTVISKLPVLDPAEVWTADASVGGHRSEVASTRRSKKVLKVLVKYEATDKHPAQTDTYNEDVPVGTWNRTLFSGAVSQERKDQLLARADALSDAVKAAVEQANMMEVEDSHIGRPLFTWLLQ